jgi:hypothetical protein
MKSDLTFTLQLIIAAFPDVSQVALGGQRVSLEDLLALAQPSPSDTHRGIYGCFFSLPVLAAYIGMAISLLGVWGRIASGHYPNSSRKKVKNALYRQMRAPGAKFVFRCLAEFSPGSSDFYVLLTEAATIILLSTFDLSMAPHPWNPSATTELVRRFQTCLTDPTHFTSKALNRAFPLRQSYHECSIRTCSNCGRIRKRIKDGTTFERGWAWKVRGQFVHPICYNCHRYRKAEGKDRTADHERHLEAVRAAPPKAIEKCCYCGVTTVIGSRVFSELMNGWCCQHCRFKEREGIIRTKEDQDKAEIRNTTRPSDYPNCWNCGIDIGPKVAGAVVLYENHTRLCQTCSRWFKIHDRLPYTSQDWGNHEFRCEVKICQRLESAEFGYVDQDGIMMILACYECRSYLEEEQRLPDEKLEEYRPKNRAGPRRYETTHNFQNKHRTLGKEFHQYMIRHGMGKAKTRKEIREAYLETIGIKEPAARIENPTAGIENPTAGIENSAAGIDGIEKPTTQKSTHKKRKVFETIEANVMDEGRPKRSVKRPVSY